TAQVEGPGRLLLRPRGPRELGGAAAAGRVRHALPRPGRGAGRRRRRTGVHRVQAAGRRARPGRAVVQARDPAGDARAGGEGPPAGRFGGAGPVRAGREPGTGTVVEAGRRPSATRPARLGSSSGSKLPARSRGTAKGTGPIPVCTV